MNITKNEMLLLGSLHKERGKLYEMTSANQSSIIKIINLQIELLNRRMMDGEQMDDDGISIPKAIADLRETANTLSQSAERNWQKFRRKKICAARCFEKAKNLEGEKAEAELKATVSDQGTLDKIKVKVLRLDFCEASNDPDLVARADVEVTTDTSFMSITGIDLRYNDATGNYSIVEPKSLSGVCMNELIRIAVTNAVVDRYEQIKHSDEMLEKLATATSIDRKEYDEFLTVISAHFDRDDTDIGDCLEECKLKLKAACAYINHLENAQLRVTKVDVAPCSMKDDPSRLADVVAVINDGLVIRGIRLYAAAPAMSPMFGKDGVYLSYPELVGSKIYPAAYPIQPTSDCNLQSQLLDKVIERYKSMSVARTLSLSWNNILQAGKKYLVKFRPSGHPHVSMLRNLVNNSAICECVMENDQPDVKNADGTPYIPEKALIVKYTITPDMTLKDVPCYAIPECEWGQSIDLAAPPRDGLLYLKPCELTKNMTENTSTSCTEAQPERPVSFIDHTVTRNHIKRFQLF